MKDIAFALIGCGRIVQKYADLFRNNLIIGGSVACVCDLNLDRAQAVANMLQVPAYRELSQMIKEQSNNIDAFVLLTDSGSHAELTKILSIYGKPIIVEKPIALTIEDANEMIQSCQKANIRLFVVKQNRYNLTIQKLKQVYDQGHFGKIVMATTRLRWCRTQQYYDQDPWRGTSQGEGGIFMNQAIHYLDLLTWFLGDPVSVIAKSRCSLVNIETEDTAVAIITFREGILGVIEATTATRPFDVEGSFSIMGENGMVEIDGFALNDFKHWHFTQKHKDLDISSEDFSETPSSVYGFGHERYLNNLVKKLRGEYINMSEGIEGKKSLVLATGIYNAIKQKEEFFF